MSFDYITDHGNERTVPDVRNMSLAQARSTLKGSDLVIEVMDSVYNPEVTPGHVIEQNPSAAGKVKPGRTVYVTVNTLTPPKVQIPALVGISLRQAVATLNSLRFSDVTEVRVPSDYKDLVIAVKSMGVVIRPGTKLNRDTPIVIEVGEGYVPEPEEEEEDDFGFAPTEEEEVNYYD